MAAVLGRDEQGNLIRKAGIMGVVLAKSTPATRSESSCYRSRTSA